MNEPHLTFPHRYHCAVPESISGGPSRRLYYPGAVLEGGHDGLIVEVTPDEGTAWTGIFALGDLALNGLSGVYSCPDPGRICIVSRGDGYLVAAEAPEQHERIPLDPILQVVPLKSPRLLLIASPWEVHAYGVDGFAWGSGRLAIDGLTLTEVSSEAIAVIIRDFDSDIAVTLSPETGQWTGPPGWSPAV